jgi:hypothetical protein
VALAACLSASAGFGAKQLAPNSILAGADGMIRLVVNLEAVLLALVLGFLISTCHGMFAAQQHHWQTIGRALLSLNQSLVELGDVSGQRREDLLQVLQRIRSRFWTRLRGGRRTVDYDDLTKDAVSMRTMLSVLRASDDRGRRHLTIAEEMCSLIFETQLTMINSLVNPVPNLLFNSVTGWTCLLFFGYGLLSAINALAAVMTVLAALSIAAAALVILELSDPYVGLFQIPTAGIDRLMQRLAIDPIADGSPGMILASSRAHTNSRGA